MRRCTPTDHGLKQNQNFGNQRKWLELALNTITDAALHTAPAMRGWICLESVLLDRHAAQGAVRSGSRPACVPSGLMERPDLCDLLVRSVA